MISRTSVLAASRGRPQPLYPTMRAVRPMTIAGFMKGLMTWERMPVNDILNPVAALCLPAVICQGSTRLQPVPPTPTGFRPPTPSPHPKPLGVIALLKALRRNPIECWTKAHFEQPIVLGGFPFGRVALVSDPAAIRKVLVENPHDYRKSALSGGYCPRVCAKGWWLWKDSSGRASGARLRLCSHARWCCSSLRQWRTRPRRWSSAGAIDPMAPPSI